MWVIECWLAPEKLLMNEVTRKPLHLKYLFSEFNKRRSRREKYSQNAFARDLNLSPSRLSQILNSRSGLSKELAVVLCDTLLLSQEEREKFIDSVLVEHSRSALERERARKRLGRRSSRSETKV